MNRKQKKIYILKKIILSVFVIIMFILSLQLYACKFFPTSQMIEQMEFCSVVSVDIEDDLYKVGVALKEKEKSSSVSAGNDGVDTDSTYFSVGKSFTDIITDLQSKRQKKIFFGDVEGIFVSNDVLAKGVDKFADFFIRSDKFSVYAAVYAVDGNAYDMISQMIKDGKDPANLVLGAKITQNQDSTDRMDLYAIVPQLKNGDSGVIPLIKDISKDDKIKKASDKKTNDEKKDDKSSDENDGRDKKATYTPKGYSVIKDKKLIATLDDDSTRGYNILKNKLKSNRLSIIIGDERVIGIDDLHVSTRIKPISEDGKLKEFKINIVAGGNIVELSGFDNNSEEEIIKIAEAELAQKIKKSVENVIKNSNDNESDFIGFFDIYAFSHKDKSRDNKDNWINILKTINFNINVDATIKRAHQASIRA